jgi:hypothetical protein
VVGGLHGDALDDGQKVFGAVADFAQQVGDRQVALTHIGDIGEHGDEADDFAGVLVEIGVDMGFKDMAQLAGADFDFDGLRLAGGKNLGLGGVQRAGDFFGEGFGIGLADGGLGRPYAG